MFLINATNATMFPGASFRVRVLIGFGAAPGTALALLCRMRLDLTGSSQVFLQVGKSAFAEFDISVWEVRCICGASWVYLTLELIKQCPWKESAGHLFISYMSRYRNVFS